MEDTLHELIEKRKDLGEPFPEAKIRSVMYRDRTLPRKACLTFLVQVSDTEGTRVHARAWHLP
jgi:hypothetical protein